MKNKYSQDTNFYCRLISCALPICSFLFLSCFFLSATRQGQANLPSPSTVWELNLRSQESLNLLIILPQTSQQWQRMISHSTPGMPLMIHSPSRPMLTVPMACWQMLSSLTMSKKLSTIATPTREKLMVANMMEGPSEAPRYIPQMLESLIRNSEQQTMQEISPMMMNTSARVAQRFCTLSSHRRNEDSLVRNTWVQAAVIMIPNRIRKMAADFLSKGSKVRYHVLLKGVTYTISDCRGLLFCLACTISQHRIDSSTSYYSVLFSLFMRAITLFISLWCYIEDSRPRGQLYKQSRWLRQSSYFNGTSIFSYYGTQAIETSQYCCIQGLSFMLFLVCNTYEHICLNSKTASDISYATSGIFLQQQLRFFSGCAQVHRVLGISTMAQPIMTICRRMPQHVARHFKQVMRPISPPTLKTTRRTSTATPPMSIHMQKTRLTLMLRRRRSPLVRSPEFSHSCSTGMMVQVSTQTDQYRIRYQAEMVSRWGLLSAEQLRDQQVSSGTSRASAKFSTHVRIDQNFTWGLTDGAAYRSTRQLLMAVSTPYWISTYISGYRAGCLRACYYQLQCLNMSFDKIKSFWRTNSEIKEDSLIERTQNLISNSFRRSTLPANTTLQFEDYLANIPAIKKAKKAKSLATPTIKPELVQKCMQAVDKQFFSDTYNIDQTFFDKRKKVNQDRQVKMHEQLDEVEVCLFNQITSRFDEILSVLRTIESLDCLVMENQGKIKTIREANFSKVIKVAQKQNKMAALMKKKKRMQQVIHYSQKLKQYNRFAQLQSNLDAPEVLQQFYATVPVMKSNIEQYRKFRATRQASLRIQQVQNTLKKSFADKLNVKLLQYLKKDIPYQPEFWRRNVNNQNLLEDKPHGDSTAMLDQSAIMGDQETYSVAAKKQEAVEVALLEYVKKGWEDGQYEVESLKDDFDAVLKSKHNAFMLDFRNFCDQICKKHYREVQNPSLTNLLKQISIVFCAKVYNYFFDIHKSLLLRYFSVARKVLQLVVSYGREGMNIQHKEKLNILAEGFISIGCYLLRIVLQKLIDIADTKTIHEGIDISEIKQVIDVLENAQNFLQKQISHLLQIPKYQQSFLSSLFMQIRDRFPVKILEIAKKRKLMDYLNKMHKNALTIQLKESLENQTWQANDIPTFYYDSLHYLITGESLNLRKNKHNLRSNQSTTSMLYETSVLMDNYKEQSFLQEPSKLISNFRIIRNDIIVEGQTYKVTQTLLLLLEMLEDYLTLAQNFPLLRAEVGVRINELIRSYNVSSCQLIVHAGAVGLQKIKSKNITSRHLALSSLCLKFILYLMGCINKRVEIFEEEKLRNSVVEHVDIIIKKLNQIIVYKVNSCKGEINLKNTPSKGTQSIVSNTKILLEILSDYYDKQILSRILTREILDIYVETIAQIKVAGRVEAEALKDDVAFMFGELKGLEHLNCGYAQMRIRAEDLVRQAFEEL